MPNQTKETPLDPNLAKLIDKAVSQAVLKLGEALSATVDDQIATNVDSLARKNAAQYQKIVSDGVKQLQEAVQIHDDLATEQQSTIRDMLEKVKLPEFKSEFHSRSLQAMVSKPEVFVELYKLMITSVFTLDRSNFLDFISSSETQEKDVARLGQRIGKAMELAMMAYENFEKFAK